MAVSWGTEVAPDLACAGWSQLDQSTTWAEGWSLGGGWHVTVMSGETWRGGGGGDAILHQGRVHQGWQKGMRLGRACPRRSFRGLQELPRFWGILGVVPALVNDGTLKIYELLRTKHSQYSNLSPNPSLPYHTPHCL